MAILKRYIAILLLLALCVGALWLRQQTFAVVALLLAVAALYVSHTKRIISIGEQLIQSAKTAKFGDLEVDLQKNLTRLSDQVVAKSAWVNLALTDLKSDELTLLLSIARTNVYTATNAIKPALRSLRDHGLVDHDADTMEASKTVTATDLGRELAEVLLATKHGVQDTEAAATQSETAG